MLIISALKTIGKLRKLLSSKSLMP